MANVTIDGIAVTVPDNINIIAAAKEAGIHVPHLCYHPRLSLSGTCRLCLVEIEKMPKLQTACSTTVRDGMVIFTNNEKVRKARAGVMEFLLINHPLDCPVCDQAGDCKLQDYALEYGFLKSRFTEEKRTYPTVEISDDIVRNMNRCVHCKRCIRFCAEIAGAEEYGPMNRGNKTSIGIFPDKKLSHRYTGAMVDLCPVGALTSKDFRFKSRTWNLKPNNAVCVGCSTGCAVVLETKGNKVLRVRPCADADENWLICDEGRLGYHFINSPNRITKSAVRSGGSLQPAKLADAVEAAAAGLRAAIAKHGADAVAGLIFSHATNEDALAFHRLIADVVKTKNHDFKLSDTSVDPSQIEEKNRRVDHSPNTRGLQLIGVGSNPETSGLKLVERVIDGRIKALIVVGASAPENQDVAPGLKTALSKLEHLVVIDILPTAFSDAAHVIIPGAAFAEKDGSFTNYAGEIKAFKKTLRPPTDVQPEWRTLADIAAALGADLGYRKPEDIIAAAVERIDQKQKAEK